MTGECEKCESWKQWAMVHQKLMLSQEKELKDKEAVIFEIMEQQKMSITSGNQRIKSNKLLI